MREKQNEKKILKKNVQDQFRQQKNCLISFLQVNKSPKILDEEEEEEKKN